MPLMIAGVKKKPAREKADSLLEIMGLADTGAPTSTAADVHAGRASSSVAIARALANDPRLVIADEPLGNVDPVTTELMS